MIFHVVLCGIIYCKTICQVKDLMMPHFHSRPHCFRGVIATGIIIEFGISGEGEEVVDVVGQRC